MTPADSSWSEACHAALVREIARLRAYLEGAPPLEAEPSAVDHAVSQLQSRFGLTNFERDLVLLCAGAEVDGGFAELCAQKQKDPRATSPTFGLALAVLPEPHWSALSPCGPLRFWRLIEVGASALLTAAPLRIDERILHYLLGVSYLDERLQPFLEIAREVQQPLPCERGVATALARLWNDPADPLSAAPIQVTGRDHATLRRVTIAGARASGHAVFSLRLDDVPAALAERYSLGTLWRRESLLNRLALLVDVEGAGETQRSALAWVEGLGGRVAMLSREPLPSNGTSGIRFEVPAPGGAERLEQWREVLGPAAANLNGELETLAASFSLPPSGLREALDSAENVAPAADHVWDLCRRHARLRLGDLARRIEPRAAWADLILPSGQKALLREICAHVRHRAHVYENWGFAGKSARGLGVNALFTGPSGTGKTTAAEVIASETRMDLYRVDLSGVVSKYIGETERNLRRVFDAAESSGAILLFDEADALFGKRSEVKDSHDRYANIEVSYLLHRMESYPGLAILTTNLKAILDPAFFRRLRFVVEFPFPDASMREEIWRGIFPVQTDTRELDFVKLARLNVAGGNIRNIALNAAFLAAAERDAVQMKHLLAAARTEYRKIDKPLTEAETGGWA